MNAERKPIRQVTVKEVKAMIDSGAKFRLIDVREDYEIKTAGLPQAVQLTDAVAQELTHPAAKDEPVVFMCHHGVRSLQAAAHFASLGLTNVSSMTGGIHAWSKEIDPSVPQY